MTDPQHRQVATDVLQRGRQVDQIDKRQRHKAVMERLFGETGDAVKVGRFEILETAGEGAMGRVYLARDPKLDRRVAIKRILTEHLLGEQVERRRSRLIREARAVAQLSHPNVVEVYDVGVVDGDVYVAMEFIEGQTLREAAEELRDDWRGQMRLYLQAGEGLAAAHAAGIVHRDFKPDNALVGRDRRVRVVDFGLAIPAKRAQNSEQPSADGEPPTLDGHNNATGDSHSRVAGGTPAYMPPEQVVGEDVGPASDQFAFCVSLYEALYGVRPFDNPDARRRVARVLAGDLEEPHRGKELPAELREALVRGLAADPDKRFPAMGDLLTALRGGVKRKSLRGPIVAGSVLTTGVLAVLVWPSDASQCDGARQSFDTVWTPARRAAIRDVFDESELRYAADTRDRVLSMLDAYRDEWVKTHRAACLATHEREEQSPAVLDLRMNCLAQRRAEFGALAEVLGDADNKLIRNATMATKGLRDIGLCSDVETLSALAPPPDDPELRRRLDVLRGGITEAFAQRVAGKHEEAIVRVGEMLVEAEDIGHDPLTAELYHLHANLLRDVSRHREAAESYEKSFFLEKKVGNDRQALRNAADLMSLHADEWGQEGDAEKWEQHARAALERLGDDPHSQARFKTGLAAVRTSQSKIEEAIGYQREVLAYYEETMGPDSGEVAEALGRLANVYNKFDRQEEAIAAHRRVQAIFLEMVGPQHPTYGITFINVGAALAATGKAQEAAQEYRTALSILERVHGKSHTTIAITLNNLGNVLADVDKHDAAIEHWTRAEKIFIDAGLEEHRATVLENIGTSLRAIGRAEEAVEFETRSIAIKESVLGQKHPDLGRALHNRGLALLDLGQTERALADYARAKAIYAASVGPKHSLYGAVQGEYGWTLVRLGRTEEGIAELEASIVVRIDALGEDHPQVVSGLHGLGAALLRAGRPLEALAPLDRAQQIAARIQTSPDRDNDLKFDMARALWEIGRERDKARRLAEEALAGQLSRPARQQADVDEIRSWLASHPL